MGVIASTGISGSIAVFESGIGIYSDTGKTTPATNGVAVACWADQSGNGNDAIQTTGGNQPTLTSSAVNGRPGITFNGVNSFLSLGQPTSLLNGMAGDFTIYCRFLQGTRMNYGTLFGKTSTANKRIWLTISDNGKVVHGNTVSAPGGKCYGDLFTASVRFTLSSHQSITSLDGFSTTGTMSEAIDSSSEFRIGRCDPEFIGQDLLSGSMLDLVVFSRALTDGEMSSLDAYYKVRDGQPTSWPYLLLFDGNSITYGQAATNYDGFAQRIAAALGVPSYAYFNMGVPGQGMSAMLGDAPAQVDSLLSQWGGKAILTFAEVVNEMNGGSETPQQAHDLAATYGMGRRTAAPNVKLVTFTVPHSNYASNADTDAYNALVRADSTASSGLIRTPNAGVTWFDLVVDLAADSFLATSPSLADGTHPTDAGHARYAADLLPAIQSFLSSLFATTSGLTASSTGTISLTATGLTLAANTTDYSLSSGTVISVILASATSATLVVTAGTASTTTVTFGGSTSSGVTITPTVPFPNSISSTTYPTITIAGVDLGPISQIDQVQYEYVNVQDISGPVTVTLTSPYSASKIHYTLNGKIPRSYSPVYTEPLTFKTNVSGSDHVALKARIYDVANANNKSKIIRLNFRVV